MRSQLSRSLVLISMFLLFVTGCNGPKVKGVELVRVRGTVTLDGKPVANGIVLFVSEDGSFSFDETDSEGEYDLKFNSQTRGVTPAKKTVSISMNRRLLGVNSNDEGSPDDTAGGSFPKQEPEQIPARYNVESELTVSVTPENRRFDFELVGSP